ncbi:MAG: hypothetical protein PHD73_13125 [Sediminibacterium sp.]|nr:hypothetical protein [Sediminibacterium sp.]
MQKVKIGGNESGHTLKRIPRKTPINFRLVPLLLTAILLQHFAFATLHNSFGSLHISSGISQTGYFEKGTIPHQESQLDLYIEIESGDEDEVHNEQIPTTGSIAKDYTFEGVHYNYFIRTLYLRLVSSNRRKVELPYFVLYHSWKSHLS